MTDIKRGPFGSALKKEFFISHSPYTVYEQSNAINNTWKTRYFISQEKFKELKKFQLVPGDFILSGAGTIGKIAQVPSGISNGVFNQALIRIKINQEETDDKFFLIWMQSEKMQRKLTQSNPGSAMTNLVPMNEIKNWTIRVPDKPEQKQLGIFIKKLEFLITLLQKELELKIALEQYLRKHLLTILKNNVPILRLKKYKYSWKNKSLDEVTNIKTGSRNHQDSVPNGKYPFFVRSANIEHLNEYDFDEKAILVPGDGKIGEIFHYYEGKFALHQRVYKIDKFKEIDPKFLLNLFKNSFKKHAIRLNAQGTVPSLRLPMFTNWKMYMPTLSEQKQIASILSSVEKSIENDKNKIKSLDALKQFLLQNMFI